MIIMTIKTQKFAFHKLFAISGSCFMYDPSSLYWTSKSEVSDYFKDFYWWIFHFHALSYQNISFIGTFDRKIYDFRYNLFKFSLRRSHSIHYWSSYNQLWYKFYTSFWRFYYKLAITENRMQKILILKKVKAV